MVSCLLARCHYYSVQISRVYLDCKTKLWIVVQGRQRKYIFTQENFYLQGVFDDINEQGTSSLDCKHKQMMKSGAPPEKLGVLTDLVPIEFHGFRSRIDF